MAGAFSAIFAALAGTRSAATHSVTPGDGRRSLPGSTGSHRTNCRHYAASVMIAQGASVKAVQRHLGHASAKTTLDTYAHLFPDAEDITRRVLEAGLVGVVDAASTATVSPLRHDASPNAAI